MTQDDTPGRIRRTMLLTPGNRAERLRKATTLNVDAVVFDIEDGVGPDHKADARAAINTELKSLDFGHRERIVRINAVGTPDFDLDMKELSLDAVDTVFVPKVESPEQLTTLDDQLAAVEMSTGRRGRIDVVATIETPRGLLNALAIADASERTSALFFGSGDYSAATGGAVSDSALAFPRATIIAAAAAAGLQAIDAAYFLSVKDAEATRADAQLAKDLGFTGKVIFHPNQIDVCNDVFSPNEAEIARARRIVDAHAAAAANGHSVAYVDGEFLAIDIVLMAQRVLRRADQIAARGSTTMEI
ncbi:MAG: HpcH/HpaI aldolase/citrate lyase family protein [Hyphomicrobiaceae bacterium]